MISMHASLQDVELSLENEILNVFLDRGFEKYQIEGEEVEGFPPAGVVIDALGHFTDDEDLLDTYCELLGNPKKRELKQIQENLICKLEKVVERSGMNEQEVYESTRFLVALYFKDVEAEGLDWMFDIKWKPSYYRKVRSDMDKDDQLKIAMEYELSRIDNLSLGSVIDVLHKVMGSNFPTLLENTAEIDVFYKQKIDQKTKEKLFHYAALKTNLQEIIFNCSTNLAAEGHSNDDIRNSIENLRNSYVRVNQGKEPYEHPWKPVFPISYDKLTEHGV